LKKLYAFLFISLLALTSIAYLYYSHWCSKQQVEGALPYIPQNAALVYEVADFGKQWKYFQQTTIAKNLDQVPAFVVKQQDLNSIMDLLETPKDLEEVPLTVSVHALGEEYLGYIFYFNTHDTATQDLLEAITTRIKHDEAYSKKVRKYAGYTLTELYKRGTTQPLSYIKHNQYIIASCTSLLIEDVVRGLVSKKESNFLNLKKVGNTQGSLYINFSQLPQCLRTFVKHDQIDAFSTSLANFTLASHLNLKLTHHNLLLSGFTKLQEKSLQCLTHTLAGQAAGTILLAPYLPQNTAILQHFTFSDAEQLLASLQQYRSLPQAGEPPASQAVNLLNSVLYPLLRGEIGHCILATEHTHQLNQLVFMKVHDSQTFIEALKGINLLTLLPSQSPQQPASTYKLTTDYFQHWLPGQLFSTFRANYITHIDDYIVLADSQLGLKTWHTQYQQGKTWANAPQQKAWLENTLDQAQLSIFINLQRIWPQVIHSLKPSWQQVFETHADTFLKFRYASLQVLHEQDAGCYISILLNHQEECLHSKNQAQQVTATQQDLLQNTPTASTIFQTDAPISNRPWLVKSHRSTDHYTLLQDALHQLYFLDSSGKLLWKKALEGPITTDLLEVDYYSNNKTQYLFATDSQVHLIDYHGHQVNRYPHPLPQPGQPVHLNVVDYNHNKHYRFLITTAPGNIYLKDKHYRPLPAWEPMALGQDFVSSPMHLRVQGKDYFLALQTNGILHALNRQGKSYPGFPIDLKAHIHNPLLVRKGKTANDTVLIALTDTGQHIFLNLLGCIQEAIQCGHLEDTARFILCPDRVAGHRYVIVQQDADKITVMSEARNLLFELQHQGQYVLWQYYDFGGHHQYHVVTNKDKQLTYLYDHTGKNLLDAPWHNGNEVSVLASEKERQLKIYVGSETSLLKYTLSY
jgi:hypothetical protein